MEQQVAVGICRTSGAVTAKSRLGPGPSAPTFPIGDVLRLLGVEEGFGAKPGFLLYRQLYSLPHAQCGVWRRDLELRDPQTQPQDSGGDDESCTKEEDTAHRR